jgi:outer membrane protein assembly factor BamB
MVVGEDGTIFKIDFFDGDASYSVTAIRPETGELAWKVPTKVSEASNSVTFAPDGDIVFLRDYDALVRVDASSQETLWSAQVASQNARTSDPDGNLYLFDAHAGCTLVALDDGQIVASGVAVPQRPVVDEMGRLYGILSDWHPHLTLTDKEGTVVWENDVDFDGNSLALSNDGSIYFMSGESIHAVASDAGLAHAGWPRVTHDARNTRNATKW